MSSISFYPQNGSVKAGETEAAISLTMRKEHQGAERKSQVFEVRKLVPALDTKADVLSRSCHFSSDPSC